MDHLAIVKKHIAETPSGLYSYEVVNDTDYIIRHRWLPDDDKHVSAYISAAGVHDITYWEEVVRKVKLDLAAMLWRDTKVFSL